jgi:lipid A 3-O-deacylase
MSIKKFILLVLCSILIYSNVNAESEYEGQNEFGVSFGYGFWNNNIDIYRLAFQKAYGVEWFKRESSYLSGFFELSFNYWEYGSDNIYGLALSPVFAYYYGKSTDFVRPYIAGGIGVALISDNHIRNRNLGSNFQFEDRIGIGAAIGRFDAGCFYFHYSNAGLKLPNEGMDMIVTSLSLKF